MDKEQISFRYKHDIYRGKHCYKKKNSYVILNLYITYNLCNAVTKQI